MWPVLLFVVAFILGFYFSECNQDFLDGRDVGGESLEDIYEKLNSEEKKEFLSECASLLAKSRKKKSDL